MHDHTSHHQNTANNYSRRRFIHTALAGAGALVAGARSLPAAPLKKSGDIPMVELGKTGIKTTLLAQGTGWTGGARSSAHTRLGVIEFNKLIRHSLDQGIRLMDTADLYGAHPYLNRALDGISRDKFEVMTKLWPREEFWNMPSGGAEAEVNRFRKELKVDTLHICLIHCMTNTDWPNQYKRILDELAEMKEKGAVRAVGVSCHDFGAMKVAAELPWTDVILARINNVGKSASMDGSVEEVSALLKKARANGKTVIGMKIFGNGKLAKKPHERDASLQYVLGNDLVDAMTIGMLNPTEVNDTIKRMNTALKA